MRRCKRGMLLLTTLIIMVILTMFLAIIVGDLRAGILLSGNYSHTEQAYWAALAGHEYARHRILKNTNWMGNDTRSPVYTPEVQVEEQYTVNGAKNAYAVHGVIKNGESEFYIAFADRDNRIVPAKDRQGGDLKYYSHNNMASLFDKEVPISLSGKKRSLQPWSVYLAVEGRSNRSRCVVEIIYALDYSPTIPSAVVCSNNMDISMKDLSSQLLFTHKAGGNPSIKSNNRINFGNGSDAMKMLNLSGGTIFAKSGIAINGMDVDRNNARDFGIKAEVPVDSTTSFPKLSWEKIMTKFGDPTNLSSPYDAKLSAGVYAFIENKENEGKYNLQYFKDNYSKGTSFNVKVNNLSFGYEGNGISVPNNGVDVDASDVKIVANAKTAITPGEKVEIYEIPIYDNKGNKIGTQKIEKKIPVNSFALVAFDWDQKTNDYVPSTKAKPKFVMERNEDATKNTAICSNGMIYIDGELSGTGSVIAGNDIDFEAGSQLEPSDELGMAIYAKGNISIHSSSETGDFNDPNSYISKAFSNYIKQNGSYYENSQKASYEILYTSAAKNKTLCDVLQDNYKYTCKQSMEMVMKVLMKNSESSGDGYRMISPDSLSFNGITSTDSILKGVVYTWQNFNADIPNGSLTIRGALVAYGGDPLSQLPGAGGSSGKVNVANGKYVHFIYDPDYLALLGMDDLTIRLRRIMFNRI
ncbi:MAG: hypothetical protein AB2L14_01600 [Candidatus Xenobiia bacterium LiM19]